MLATKERHELLVVERTRNVDAISAIIKKVMTQNPTATLLDIEMAFRDAAAQTYLVMDVDSNLHIVFGMQAWRDTMIAIGREHELNNKTAASENHGRLA